MPNFYAVLKDIFSYVRVPPAYAWCLRLKADAPTHQLNDTMALYVSFRRALRDHTTVWYEPLEEENVGHGGCEEVTGDVYKHSTAPAQRRLSIERVGVKDGAFLATFGKGAIGRARSESRSTFVSKLMHEHLATEARRCGQGRRPDRSPAAAAVRSAGLLLTR